MCCACWKLCQDTAGIFLSFSRSTLLRTASYLWGLESGGLNNCNPNIDRLVLFLLLKIEIYPIYRVSLWVFSALLFLWDRDRQTLRWYLDRSLQGSLRGCVIQMRREGEVYIDRLRDLLESFISRDPILLIYGYQHDSLPFLVQNRSNAFEPCG